MFLYQDYFDYFRAIAESLVDVSDFHHYDLLEFLEGSRNNKVDASNYLLCLESYTPKLEGQYIDNLRYGKTASFSIIKEVKNQNQTKADEKAEVLSTSEQLALEVIAKMKKDKRLAHQVPELRFMGGLSLTSFQFFKLSQIWKNFYGWRVEFSFHEQAKLVMDKSLWKQN